MKKKPHPAIDREPSPLIAAVDALKKDTPAMLQFMGTLAKLKRQYYKELLKEGFTETEALSLTASFSVTSL